MLKKPISILILIFCFIVTGSHGSEDDLVSAMEPQENVPKSTISLIELWNANDIHNLYESLKESDLNFDMLKKGILGLQRMKKMQPSTNANIITLIDFSRPSYEERFYVIDLSKKEILIKTHVTHGRASGEIYASNFSNTLESHQSSLGFYLTGETYHGKHGYSLRLDGMEYGINDNARNRAIVLHSADYATEEFIQSTGRLGRSLGCPAVSPEVLKNVIQTTKDKSCLFIYHPSDDYLSQSKYMQYAVSNSISDLISFYNNR